MITIKRCLFVTALIFIIGFLSCSSSEIGESKDVAQDRIYQHYTINYSEGDENAAIYAQFRFAGDKGTTLVLSEPAKIEFDGEKIKVDSNNVAGAFYRLYKPVKSFGGKHTLVFTDINNRQYNSNFLFDTFKLVNIPSAISKSTAFQLNFRAASLLPGDHIEVGATNTDSAFCVTFSGPATGTAITIPQQELIKQKGEMIALEATLYRKLIPQQTTTEGGLIEIIYSLKPVTVQLKD